MEINKVVLSLKEYNELIDFKKGVESEENKGKILVVQYRQFGSSSTRFYHTESEVILFFEELNKSLEKEVKELESEVSKYKLKLDFTTNTINRFKNMSYWEFRKWRKSELEKL